MSLEALFSRRAAGIRLGLEAVDAVYVALGRPAAAVPAIHIVGTNGKGSTAAMIDHALRGHGLRAGLFTSPHLHRVTERVRLGGVPDDDNALEAAAARVLAVEQQITLPRPLSFFEVLTLAAWQRFAEANVDVIVAEAGMGGRHDATRLCEARVVAIASIDLDHQAWLGDTRAAIAAEKVAVARAGVPVFTVQQLPEVLAVLRDHTAAIGAPLTVVEPVDVSPRGLVGDHQRHNAALALAAARVLVPAVEPSDLDGVVWPGRFERIARGGGTLVVDVAHNPAGVTALLAALAEHQPGAAVAVGTVADKDVGAIAGALERSGRAWAWVDLRGFGTTGARPDGVPMVLEDLASLLAWVDHRIAQGGSACVCGSHVLVAALRARVLGLPEAQPGER